MNKYQQTVNTHALETGYILKNYGVPKESLYFKFLGSYYVTNPQRKTKYSLDNPKWHSVSKSLFRKLYLILSKQAHKVS